MDDLGGADGGQVAVALIGEDDLVRMHALGAGGHRRGAAMGGLVHIAVEVVIGKHGAADRGDANDVLLLELLREHLGHQTVDDAVGAAGAVVERRIREELGALEDGRHYNPSFMLIS